MRSRISTKPVVVPRRLCIAGLSHQATVLSACFARMGHWVTTVGCDEAVLAKLKRGKAPTLEPKLDGILRREIKSGRLKFTSSYGEAMHRAELVFIAIDTPVNDHDKPQLATVLEAARAIGQFWHRDMILCVTAQVPVGTCQALAEVVSEQKPGERCDVAYIAEFLRVGDAVNTFVRADRFVIGTLTKHVANRVAELYVPLARPILRIGLRSAEMAKHACNAFLATSISFINEIADLCDHVDADSLEVAQAMKLDHRIGPQAFLSPGLGFAGGTLGRDVRALEDLGRQHGRKTLLLDAVMRVNSARAAAVKEQLIADFNSLRGVRIGVLGVTYKAGTNTLRRSLALELIADLVAEGAEVRACDPLADWKSVGPLPNFSVSPDAYTLAENCDALVLVTEWQGILDLDLQRLRRVMRRPVFIDTRNLFDPEEMSRAGFEYSGLGRGKRHVALAAH
jgi:UDPglucose 6-dehydrogenase